MSQIGNYYGTPEWQKSVEAADPHIKGYKIAKEKLKGFLPDDNFPYDDIYDIIADAYVEGFIDATGKEIKLTPEELKTIHNQGKP